MATKKTTETNNGKTTAAPKKTETQKVTISNLDKLIARKTEEFRSEVDCTTLNEEQKRIWNAFVFRRSKPYHFAIQDRSGNTIRFSLYTNKTDDGVMHIMAKHYNGNVGPVTAKKIVSFCDVIRNGNIDANPKAISYNWKTNGWTYTLTVALKRTGEDDNVLKSFYSDRKKIASGTAGSSNNDCGANSKSRGKINKKKPTSKKITKKN